MRCHVNLTRLYQLAYGKICFRILLLPQFQEAIHNIEDLVYWFAESKGRTEPLTSWKMGLAEPQERLEL